MNRTIRILLVNPPIYDFSAYDFWMKPYGLLRVAGKLRDRFDLHWFDFLYPPSDGRSGVPRLTKDIWGRGAFPAEIIKKPEVFNFLPRFFRRFGVARECFQDYLKRQPVFDMALIQTGMTYWYPGVVETIEYLTKRSVYTKIVLGGCYATLCPPHALSLGADVVIQGADLAPLWDLLGVSAGLDGVPYWDVYAGSAYGILKLSDGCPYHCSYCASNRMFNGFTPRPLEAILAELNCLKRIGINRIAFYDDALLVHKEKVLGPFLERILEHKNLSFQFHTPNALHARLITADFASLMVQAGFTSFFLGAENISAEWLSLSGGKVKPEEIAVAADILKRLGVSGQAIIAYLLIGHPSHSPGMVEASMRWLHHLGIRIMLAEYSPVPGTADAEKCREIVPLEEPLWHNKTAFTVKMLGWEEVCRLKNLAHRLNRSLGKN